MSQRTRRGLIFLGMLFVPAILGAFALEGLLEPVQGMIDAVERVAAMAGSETKIIPGHGPLADKKALMAYRTMLETAQVRLSKLKREGKSASEAVAAKPLSDLETEWGGGFLPTDKWISIVYDGV